MLKFEQADADRMQHVQAEITRAVVPYRGNTEAALVIFALCRVARVLLDRYPPETRARLAEVITAFLSADKRKGESLIHKFLFH